MIDLALAGKCGFFGAIGSVDGVAHAESPNSDANAIEPRPMAQSWKNQRRVVESISCMLAVTDYGVRVSRANAKFRRSARADANTPWTPQSNTSSSCPISRPQTDERSP